MLSILDQNSIAVVEGNSACKVLSHFLKYLFKFFSIFPFALSCLLGLMSDLAGAEVHHCEQKQDTQVRQDVQPTSN